MSTYVSGALMSRAMHDGTVLVTCVLAVAFLLAWIEDRHMRRRR